MNCNIEKMKVVVNGYLVTNSGGFLICVGAAAVSPAKQGPLIS